MNTKTFLMIMLSTIIIESIICQDSFDFQYEEIKATIFPKEPGICPNTTTDVTCIEEFDSYKWEMVNPVSGFIPLYGQTQTLAHPGAYILTVETSVNNVLCSKEFLFNVHDLKDAAGIEAYLQNNGFYSVPITIDQFGNKGEDENKTMCDLSIVKFNDDYKFIDLSAENIFSNVLNEFKPFAGGDYDGIEVKSKNACFCDVGVDNLEDDFYGNNYSIWVHEFAENEDDNYGKLYMKGIVPYEGESPKDEEHINHLSSFHNDIITNPENNSDPIKASAEHLRVIISNLFMMNPTGGYSLDDQCEIDLSDVEDVHLFTPGGTAILMPINATNIIIENNINSPAFGSLIQFNLENKKWQNYHRNEDYIVSSGFYNSVNAEFFELFTTSITSCNECDIEIASIAEDCENFSCTLVLDLYTTDNFDLEGVKNGGFNYEIEDCNSTWRIWPVSKRASKELIYNLLCALKNGDASFTYSSKFKDKVVFARHVTLGEQIFDYVGLTLPKEGEEIELLETPILNNYSTIPGFTNSFEISTESYVRLNFYYFDQDGNFNAEKKCKSKLKPSYTYAKWANKIGNISSCLQYYNLSEKYKLLDYLIPPDNENLLLMVNGYRIFRGKPGKKWYKGGVEYPTKDPQDAINACFDYNEGGDYWGEKSQQFAKRINSNVVYADGHHSISTSNHIRMITSDILETSFHWSISSCSFVKALCNNSICFLNSTPNNLGFIIRYNNGYIAGSKLWDQMVNGEIDILLSEGQAQILGKIDIVAHSFGYAYSKGMLDYLSTKLAPGNTFGNYYIIAPENAKVYLDEDFNVLDSDTQYSLSVDLGMFENVYQYGSDFTVEGDSSCKQDGVAAQSRVRGLSVNNLNNVFIPSSENHNKLFIKAHQMTNYDWIFNISQGQKGYVEPRE